LEIGVGSADHIIHEELKFQKVCARWVPYRLTPEMKERRVDACQELLRRYEADGEAFLQRIVTGDESWVHFYERERKRQSMEWPHTSSPKPKKARVQRSAGKVMLTFLSDYKGPMLEHYMPRGSTDQCHLLRPSEGKSEASYSLETARVVDYGCVSPRQCEATYCCSNSVDS